jgi:glycosyltransferase involved in cell wall biosynthesis
MNNENFLLSLVIAAYNVEDYIEPFLSSIFNKNNSLERVEVVIINDGSTDKTKDLIEAQINDRNNVTLISTENTGLSGARNIGFEKSSGQYIWFLDSDDIIEQGAIDLILNNISENRAVDMFKFNYSVLKQVNNDWVSSGDFGTYNNFSGKTITGKNCLKPFLLGKLEGATWSNILKRQLIIDNNIKFKAGIYYQDQSVCIELFKNSKKIQFIPNTLIQYRIREGSTTLSCNDNHINSIFISTSLIFDSIHNIKKIQHDFLVYYWHQLLANIAKRQENITLAQVELFIKRLQPSLEHIKYNINKKHRDTFIIRCQLELLAIFDKKIQNNNGLIREFCRLIDLPSPRSAEIERLEKKINSITFKVINKCKSFM